MSAVFKAGDSGLPVAQIVALLTRIGVLEDPAEQRLTTDRTAGDGGAVDGQPSSGRVGGSHAGRLYDHEVELAVRDFQQQRGLTVDGIVGPLTFRRLNEARWRLGDRILTHRPADLIAGDDVYALQGRLLGLGFRAGRLDGYFGPDTEAGVREFQRNLGIPPDGTCGPATLKALTRLSPMVKGGAPNTLRSQERIREAGPNLGGKTVVIDVGRGHHLPEQYTEDSDNLLHDVAQRVEGRLVATGVQAFLSASRSVPPADEAGRAAFANRTGADLLVSLSLDASAHADACGVSTYFFGDAHPASWSASGERFAGLVQREIVARSDLADLRCHPKTWDLLRHTRMPAIRLEAGYLTNSGDAARLRDPRFRDMLAEAIVVSVQRFYLSPEVDAHTGVLQVSELRDSFRGA